MINTEVKIGFSTNLIKGFNPHWSPQSKHLNILYPVDNPAMEERLVNSIGNHGSWSFPTITLHETALDLLNELIPYQIVNPSSDIDAPDIGAGALLVGMLDNQASLQTLSETVGVDLTNPDLRYALVKLNRRDGVDTHAAAAKGIFVHALPNNVNPEYKLSESFLSASRSLPHFRVNEKQGNSKKLTQKQATKILSHFNEFGTHYISAVELGDTILQVFAYSSEKFRKIKQAYVKDNPFVDFDARYFAQYTTDSEGGHFGYVKQYGKIICLSDSQKFKSTLDNGDWFEGVWSHKNSLFALFNQSPKLSYYDLNEDFIDQVSIRIQLTSLCMMVEHKRALLWKRIFKGAMAQKYQTNINPNFVIYDTRDFVSLLPEDQAGVISYIATPTVNLYKARLDISEMQWVAAEQVEQVTFFSNVLSATHHSSEAMVIPGQKVSLFSQVFDMRTQGQPKSIILDDVAFSSLEIACDEFLGALVIKNRSGTSYSVIVDGLKFGLANESGITMPVIESDVRVVPPIHALPLLIDSLQFSMTFAEAVISDQSGFNNKLQFFVHQYLTWLAEMIPSTTEDEIQLALRVQAMDLSHYAMDRKVGSFVPILPATEYEELVGNILDYLEQIYFQIINNEEKLAARRQQELTIEVANTLNENIIASGKLINDVIGANAEQQKELEKLYDSLISAREREAEEQQLTVNDLDIAVLEAQNEVGFAIQKYKTAVKQWKISEEVKFALSVATDMFSLGTSIAIPASSISAVKDLGLLVQRVQKTMNILNATSKLYSGIQAGKTGLENAQKALDSFKDQFGNQSALSWDEMTVHFNAIIALGPDVKVAKTELQEAFSMMVLRGKAAMSAASSLRAIDRDIYAYQQQNQLNHRQAERLKQLNGKLNPIEIQVLQKEGIDLIGLTGHLSFIQNQMLAILAKAFLLQDQALQYANLQPATAIPSFSLIRFSAALVKQKQTTIEAKSKLAQHQPMITTPIDFVIEGVKPEEITGDRSFSSMIQLDAPEFYHYVDAKVISVIASIEGVESSEYGDYFIRLLFTGSPFQDRDINRNPLAFQTPARERLYSYRGDGTANFSDEGKSWSKGVSRITPFSTWEISLPDSINKGIIFNKEKLTIHLTFILEARILDIETHKRLCLAACAMTSLGAPVLNQTAFSSYTPLTSQPSKEDLISALYVQGSCTNGWDVVFNMGLNQINASLKVQYEELKNSTVYKNTINIDASDTSYPGVTLITRFTINYGYPLLSFDTNNNKARLETMILPGSSIQKCTQPQGGTLTCQAVESIESNILSAIIDLSLVEGVVNGKKVLSVALEMERGSFSISNIDLNDQTKVAFNQNVKAYFVENKVEFIINRLDLTTVPVLEDMKPSHFIFKLMKTKAGNEMLQLYIMTGGRSLLGQSNAYLNNIPEPLPLGYDTSLIIRSGLIFDKVIPASLKMKGWSVKGVNPGNDAKAWQGTFSSANVTADVDLSPLNRMDFTQGGGSISTSYSVKGGPSVAFSLADTSLTVHKSGQLYYSGHRSQSISYEQRTYTSIPFGGSFEDTQPYSTDFNLSVSAYLSLSVGGDGRNQTIEIKTDSKTVVVDGHLSGGGPCSSDDLAAQVNQKVRGQIPDQIKKQLEMRFDSISMFALENLLFTSKNYIQFSDCTIPGDLLLLGKFIQ